MDLLTDIKKVKPLPHEQVLRHVVHKIRNNYSDKWLLDICNKQGTRDIVMDYFRRGVIDGLKGYPRNSYYPPRLTIELVPRSSWFNNVRSEVTSKQWNALKKKTAKAANYCCEICGGKGQQWPVECHEIWHYDEDAQLQLLAGLISLCPSCHEVKHIGLTELKGKRDEATAHLAIVNGWSLAGADDYIEHSFDIWRHRSELPWQVDISWLEGEGIRLYSETS
ncbi:HNH endonuclease [Pantoea sp. y20]